jgi:septal ring factor EnvC (AmiA/AmiB activator)
VHMMLRCSLILITLLAGTSCGKQDNSADTDRPGQDLRKARSQLREGSQELAANQDDIEKKKRAILSEQQQVADQEQLLEQQRQQLGSAQGSLQEAWVAYAAAVKQRLAKLDASLATVATKTDARSRDLVTGLRARRDQLSAKLAAMPSGAADPSWTAYTKDVDTTFDAIEHDLHDAM